MIAWAFIPIQPHQSSNVNGFTLQILAMLGSDRMQQGWLTGGVAIVELHHRPVFHPEWSPMLLHNLHVRVEVVFHVKLGAFAARVGDVDESRHDHAGPVGSSEPGPSCDSVCGTVRWILKVMYSVRIYKLRDTDVESCL